MKREEAPVAPAQEAPAAVVASTSVTVTSESEESATSSWGTMTETGGDWISEGQWIVSARSEGEIAAAANVNTAWRERMRERAQLTSRSIDDTMRETIDLERDQVRRRSGTLFQLPAMVIVFAWYCCRTRRRTAATARASSSLRPTSTTSSCRR